MISRHWRGIAKKEAADRYLSHLRTDTFPQLSKIAGFLDASILRRSVQEGVEFLIVTRWKSIEAIRKFAGENEEYAVVPQKAQTMMVRYDQSAVHYEVVE
jgi:heme-degrading monooxygenase HmoA